MKKYLIICILMAGINYDLIGQAELITIDEFSLEGVVFSSDYEASFDLGVTIGRFTPTLSDIVSSEELLRDFDINNKAIKKGKRQYLGYIQGNNRILLIHVLKNKCKKQFSKDFPEWTNIFTVMLVEPDEKEKSFVYKVDLTDKKIDFY